MIVKRTDSMKSLMDLYKIGKGPSSSHTMGPESACKIFKELNPDADSFKVILYGSLSKTGVGHGTDRIIKETLLPVNCEVVFDYSQISLPHPNTMELISYMKNVEQERVKVFSIGGGSIAFENDVIKNPERIYQLDSFSSIAKYCEEKNIKLWEYAIENEDKDFVSYMYNI